MTEPSQLKSVSKILKLCGLAEPQVQQTLQAQRTQGGLVGNIAVEKGFVTADQLEDKLKVQAMARAEAAATDLQAFEKDRDVNTEWDLKPFYGPGGRVQDPDPNMSPGKAASTIANWVELITVLALCHQSPDSINVVDIRDNVVEPARRLVGKLAYGEGAEADEQVELYSLRTELKKWLSSLAPAADADKVAAYTTNRDADICEGFPTLDPTEAWARAIHDGVPPPTGSPSGSPSPAGAQS